MCNYMSLPAERVCMCVYVYIYIHTYIHLYIYIYIYMMLAARFEHFGTATAMVAGNWRYAEVSDPPPSPAAAVVISTRRRQRWQLVARPNKQAVEVATIINSSGSSTKSCDSDSIGREMVGPHKGAVLGGSWVVFSGVLSPII